MLPAARRAPPTSVLAEFVLVMAEGFDGLPVERVRRGLRGLRETRVAADGAERLQARPHDGVQFAEVPDFRRAVEEVEPVAVAFLVITPLRIDHRLIHPRRRAVGARGDGLARARSRGALVCIRQVLPVRSTARRGAPTPRAARNPSPSSTAPSLPRLPRKPRGNALPPVARRGSSNI